MTSPIIDGGNAFSSYAATTTTVPSTAGGVFAPDAATYTTRTPYITSAEFTEAGTGVDVSQLVPQGSADANAAALTRVISRASAWADSLTYKVLAATVDTQAGMYRPKADGSLIVPLAFAPIFEVASVSLGSAPWNAAPLSDLSRVGIAGTTAVIGCGYAMPYGGPGGGFTDYRGRRFVAVTYVNGYTCTTLAGSTAQGDLSLNLAANLGVYPGQVLTLDDGGVTERVQVAATYTPGASGPVPLTAPVVNVHPAGVSASAMPQDIKQAVISLTACLIKVRGSEALVMQSMGSEPTNTEISQAGGIEDFELAADLLERHRRVW